MPSKLRVTLCQMHVGADKLANIAKAVGMIAAAADRGSELAVLPECFNSPYSTKVFDEYSESLEPGQPTYDAISAVARDKKVWVIAGSIPEKDAAGKIFNSSMTFGPDGTLRHVQRKMHLFRLFTEQVTFDEAEVLTAGDSAIAVDMPDHGIRFGVGICFDIRFPLFAYQLASQKTSFTVFPSAFNMVTGPLHWDLNARARAVDNQQFVMLCSPARDETAGYVAYGHSMVVDPLGKIIAQMDEKEGHLDAEMDFGLIAKARDSIPILKGLRTDVYSLQWKPPTD